MGKLKSSSCTVKAAIPAGNAGWVSPQELDLSSAKPVSSSTQWARKRKEPSQPSAGSRSKRTCTPIAPSASAPLSQHHLAAQMCGAGPPTPALLPGSDAHNSVISSASGLPTNNVNGPSDDILISTAQRRSKANARDTTDVYYFLCALDTKAPPAEHPNEASEPVLRENPKTEHLGCKACTTTWQTWTNNAGVTSTVRRHLVKEHTQLYHTTVALLGLKPHVHPPASMPDAVEKQPFSVQGFERKVVRWAAVDDQ
ncbi:hypothetical protein TRAPUB_2306, partial [Trametes pubescens]